MWKKSNSKFLKNDSVIKCLFRDVQWNFSFFTIKVGLNHFKKYIIMFYKSNARIFSNLYVEIFLINIFKSIFKTVVSYS